MTSSGAVGATGGAAVVRQGGDQPPESASNDMHEMFQRSNRAASGATSFPPSMLPSDDSTTTVSGQMRRHATEEVNHQLDNDISVAPHTVCGEPVGSAEQASAKGQESLDAPGKSASLAFAAGAMMARGCEVIYRETNGGRQRYTPPDCIPNVVLPRTSKSQVLPQNILRQRQVPIDTTADANGTGWDLCEFEKRHIVSSTVLVQPASVQTASTPTAGARRCVPQHGLVNSAASPAPCHGGLSYSVRSRSRAIEAADGGSSGKPTKLDYTPSGDRVISCTSEADLATLPHQDSSSRRARIQQRLRSVAGTGSTADSRFQREAVNDQIVILQTRRRLETGNDVMDQTKSPSASRFEEAAPTTAVRNRNNLHPPSHCQTTVVIADKSVSSDSNSNSFLKRQRDLDQIAPREQARSTIGTKDNSACSGDNNFVLGLETKRVGREVRTKRAGDCHAGLFEELLDPGVISIYLK